MSKVKKSVRKVGVRNVKVRKLARQAVPAVKVEVRELDPVRKCGPGTSVRHLLRVIERSEGRATSHLVYFDRHGWYCEHGRACHAVKHAQKQARRR